MIIPSNFIKIVLLITTTLLTLVSSSIYAQNDAPISSDTTSKPDVTKPFLSTAETDIKKIIDYCKKRSLVMLKNEQFYLHGTQSARFDVFNAGDKKIYYLSPIMAKIPKVCNSKVADGILFHGDKNIFRSIPIHYGGASTIRYIMLCNANGKEWIRYKSKVNTLDGKSCILKTKLLVDGHSAIIFKTTSPVQQSYSKSEQSHCYVKIN